MKPDWHKGRLPNINLKRLLAGPAPECVPNRKARKVNIRTLKYIIWHAVNTDMGQKRISEACGSERRSISAWLKAYGVEAQYGAPKYNISLEVRAQMKELHDGGRGLSYKELGQKFGFKPRSVRAVAKKMGWFVDDRPQWNWSVKGRFPKNTIPDYAHYCRTVRYVTNVMCKQYASQLDPKGKRGNTHHIDHRLSIYDAFNSGDVPMPWQMIAHPANLVLLSGEANRAKGKISSIGPDELRSRIKRFEAKFGVVALPVITGINAAGRFIYNKTSHDTIADRIVDEAKVTLAQAKKIIQKPHMECPPVEFRAHYRRPQIVYIVWAYVKGHTNRKMATTLGRSANSIKCVLGRIGLTRPTAKKINHVTHLARKGWTVKSVATRLGITSLEALCLYNMQ